jgi:DNA primase
MIGGLVDQIAQENLRLVRIKEDFVSAACPFHKEGQESHPSFWISRETGKWGCFSCPALGSCLKWLLKELGLKSLKIEAILEDAERDAVKNEGVFKAKARLRARKSFKGEHTLPDALLGVFDWMPNELVEQGFDPKILKEHDVGYDKRNDRITFPIRDLFGNLLGISGRATRPGEQPKYLVYNGRHESGGKTVNGELGEWYPDYSNEGVRDHLWRMDKCYQRINRSNTEQLIVVEGYKACLWMVQQGWTNTVALMGARLSPAQERIIRSLGPETFVLLDNNYAGKSGSEKICQTLAVGSFPVYRCHYPSQYDEDTQPDDLDEQELNAVLSNATRVGGRHGHGLRSRWMGRKPRPRPQSG